MGYVMGYVMAQELLNFVNGQSLLARNEPLALGPEDKLGETQHVATFRGDWLLDFCIFHNQWLRFACNGLTN